MASKNKKKAQLGMIDFKGCMNCILYQQDKLEPCDFRKYEVQVTFIGNQFIGEAKAFSRGDVIYGDAVICNGMIYCISCYSPLLKTLHKIDLLGIKVKLCDNDHDVKSYSSVVRRNRSPWVTF